MRITVAKSAGFCFGVKKAVETVTENLNKYNSLSTFGPIIHNPQVVEDFKQKGVLSIDEVDNINTEATVIRSHGAPPEVFEKLAQKGITVIDATCPYVARIQQTVAKAWKDGYEIVI